MSIVLPLIEQAIPTGRPKNEDVDIIMESLFNAEQMIAEGTTPSDVLTIQTGIPYPLVEKYAASEARTLFSKSMSPLGDSIKTGDEVSDTLMLYLTSFIQGFCRGLTMRKGLDLEEIIDDAPGFYEAIEAIIGDVDRESIEYAGKVTAIRMKIFVMSQPPDDDTWPHMSQWYDGFLCGWTYVTAKAVRHV